MSVKEKWNERYRDISDEIASAAYLLQENLHLLPEKGIALDLACGRGGNAILLAQHGLQVHAWDISDVVIELLQHQVKKLSLPIVTEVRDIGSNPPESGQFDVIVVSYFLERNVFPALVSALKPGGLIFYQTFTQERVSDRGPQRGEFRLARQELLQLLAGLDVIVYREEGLIGNVTTGLRDEALFVGRKPA